MKLVFPLRFLSLGTSFWLLSLCEALDRANAWEPCGWSASIVQVWLCPLPFLTPFGPITLQFAFFPFGSKRICLAKDQCRILWCSRMFGLTLLEQLRLIYRAWRPRTRSNCYDLRCWEVARYLKLRCLASRPHQKEYRELYSHFSLWESDPCPFR